MKHLLIITFALTLFLSGWAAHTSFNINNSSISTVGGGALSNYADYGSEVSYNEKEKTHQLSIFTSWRAGCDDGAYFIC